MNADKLLAHFDRISEAPDALARLRKFVLDLAVRGKLVEQDPRDEPASELLKRVQAETAARIRAGEFREPKSIVSTARNTLPFTVPQQWGWSRLIEIAKPAYGFAFESAKFNSAKQGMPLIRIRDISNEDTEAYYDGAFDHAYVVRAGDYLVGMDGDFNIARWKGPDALLNQRVLRLTGWCCGLNPEFVRIPLQFTLDHLHGLTSQTTVKHLSAKQVNGIEIPLPPLSEQDRIVARVDELMALCDELEAARAERETTRDRLASASLQRLNQPDADPAAFRRHAEFYVSQLQRLASRADHVKQIRQTVFNLAVRGKLVSQTAGVVPFAPPQDDTRAAPSDKPRNWRYLRLAKLLAQETRNGHSRRPDDAEDGVPILRISAGTARSDGIVAEEEHKLISGIDDEARRQFGLRAGDLLACRFNGNKGFVGRFSIFTDYLGISPIYPDKLIRVRVNECIVSPKFLRMAGDADLVRSQVEASCATTVGNWGISATNLKEVCFPIPPLEEQHRIIAKVDELLAVCDQLEVAIKTGAETSRRLLEAALHDALNGDPLAFAA